MTNQTAVEPVRKHIAVSCDVETAFATFTNDIAAWWPVATHSITGDPDTVIFEQRAGGRVFELARDGKECDWATILAFEPPTRVVLEWRVNPAAPRTEVEVRFTPDGDGTLVELEHRGWERYEGGGVDERASYDSGWHGVLGKFAEALPG